jgi:predicted AAA+ superfamily ATPase
MVMTRSWLKLWQKLIPKPKSIIGDYKYIFIDEVQRIPNIGLKLKIIIDQIKDVQNCVSGSSAFDINNLTQEPLTGRKLSIICILSLGVNLKIVLVT